MELAGLMVALVVVIFALVCVNWIYNDRQVAAMRTMCEVIDRLHTVCPSCGGRPGVGPEVIRGETIPPQSRQEPQAVLMLEHTRRVWS